MKYLQQPTKTTQQTMKQSKMVNKKRFVWIETAAFSMHFWNLIHYSLFLRFFFLYASLFFTVSSIYPPRSFSRQPEQQIFVVVVSWLGLLYANINFSCLFFLFFLLFFQLDSVLLFSQLNCWMPLPGQWNYRYQ